MSVRRAVSALIGVLLVPLTWAQTPAFPDLSAYEVSAQPDVDLLRAVWTTYQEILEDKRLRPNIEQVFAILNEQGVAVPAAQRERVFEQLAALEQTKLPSERPAALAALNSALEPVLQELLQLVPPVSAFDPDDDDGTKVQINWRPVPGATGYIVGRYPIERKVAVLGVDEWQVLSGVLPPSGPTSYRFMDSRRIAPGDEFHYAVLVVRGDGDDPAYTVAGITPPVEARRQWFNGGLAAFLVLVLLVCGAVVFFIERARAGVNLKVRRIAGLAAVDDAVGRSVEMGRPILFVPGISEITEVQTVAGLIILGRVGTTAAQYDAHIEVPNRDPLVMTAARETLQTAYSNAGRPDSYHEDMAYFVSQEQFAYVANVTGTMVREEPSACFYMGSFFAESLILAETGNLIGSIQIAGTANPAQLPFFVAACDYTLIGEEFFAASAYLSGEPHQLGSLKGQDVGKIITLIFVVIGVTLATMLSVAHLEDTWVFDVLDFIKEYLLKVEL